jgi:glycosyltransferase involved in cell wall biosynthesis
MRVVHIVHGKCNPNEHNGISRVVYYLNKHEKLQGVNSEIWAVVDDAKTHYQKVRDEFVTVECYPRVRVPFGRHEIIEALKKEKDSIDLVHFHMIWFYDKNIIANELIKLGIPYIITTHGTYSNPHAYTGKRKIVRSLYELRYLQKASAIHIITREEGTGLQKYGYNGKVLLAYNGVELEEIPQFTNKKLLSNSKYENRIIIGWVGVFRKDKNLDSLIKGVSLMKEDDRKKFVIVLVGPDNNGNANRYMKMIKDLKCEENFEWIGPLYNQEKYDAYYSFDAYMMPSYSEGFSMAILDAMACSKPCLLTRGCNMNYFNTSGKEFFIPCEPYPQDIAIGIKQLLEAKDKWSQYGQNARRLVEDYFNWPAIVETIIPLYKSVIAEER